MTEIAKAKPKFGDPVENGWASEDNPTRRGFFVREIRNGARKTWEITDGKGKFWRCPLDPDHKLTWAPTSRRPTPPRITEEAVEAVKALAELLAARSNLERLSITSVGECVDEARERLSEAEFAARAALTAALPLMGGDRG